VKVLKTPSLQDDYYLNLIDWSKHDFLAVELADSAYLWSPRNAKVTRLCELPHNNLTTAVGCADKQPLLAVGALSGEVQVWDAVKEKKTLTLQGHTQRVGAATWNGSLLTTGSRDKTIILRDIRMNSVIVRLVGHKQEVCGLKWSPDGQQLCSGGNDNRLLVWSQHSLVPLLRFSDHTAAVKAVAWSPHQHGLLASGGGTADRTIKFRNTLTG
jgi:cell division cycle 20-like protein 1 (cofactor of APC complex)